MKRKTVVISQQSLFDIALLEYGSVLSVFDLALNNNLSITDTPPPGTTMKLEATEEMDISVQDYCIRKSLNIATMTEIDENLKGVDFVLANLMPYL